LHSDQNKGLTEHKAFDLFQQLGENALTEKVATPWYFMLLKEFTSFFALLLWGGGILCFIGYGVNPSSLDNIFLAIVLWCVVILTGTFSYLQQSKTASLMADFQNFIPKLALCCREGKWNNIEARLLVPGDLVQVKAGDNIPADLILIQANEMKVNNASLTGESEDLLRNVDGKTMNIFETQNVAFFGTSCTTGNGVGVVFRTGDNTVIGRIAGLASSADVHETTLALEIQRFVKLISAIAIIIGVVFFLFGVFYGYRMVTNIVFAIGIIVANVPEGLLATMTVALALSAKRMATKMVLVKNLESIETLGSASCICSDKTGTLTQNRMTVSQIYCNLKVEDASVNWEIYKRLEELES
jgi:sodium/potassium-transporting ATPase subunit alpha